MDDPALASCVLWHHKGPAHLFVVILPPVQRRLPEFAGCRFQPDTYVWEGVME